MLLISDRIKCVGLLGVFGLLSSAAFAGGPSAPAKDQQLSVAQAQEKLNKASNRYIENAGQWPSQALFMGRSQNLNVWVTKKGVTFDYFRQESEGKNPTKKGQVVSMSFKGANGFHAAGDNKVDFVTDYLQATGKKRKTAKSYLGVMAKNIYPGVSFHGYYDQEKPRYDLIVAPNANPNVIKLGFHGADKTAISGNSISLTTQIGTLMQGKLFAYQQVGNKRVQIPASFVAAGKDQYGFKLGAYDHSKQLVIDPLVYGTYYGGDSGWDEVRSVVTDHAGGVYMTGYTMAPDFPAIDGPYGFTIHGGKDAFVSKLQGDAFFHDYAAFIKGSLDDYAQFIKIDPFGDVWVAGRTQSSDFAGNEVFQRPNQQDIAMTSTGANAPATGGTFKISYGGGVATTVALPFNATAQMMADALNNALGLPTSSSIPEGPGQTIVYVTRIKGGPSLDTKGVFRVSLPWNFPLLLTFPASGNKMGAKYVLSARRPGQAVELAPTNGTAPSGGTYALVFNGGAITTAPIPYNAAPAAVQAAINAAFGNPAGGICRVLPDNPTAVVPPFVIEFINGLANNPPSVDVDNALLTGGGIYQINSCSRFAISWDPTTSFPTGGNFLLQVTTGLTAGVAQFPWNVNNVAIRTTLALLQNVGANNVVTDVEPVAGVSTLPTKTITITFCGTLANTGVAMAISSAGINPQPVYSALAKTSDIFVMRFQQSATTVLDPVSNQTVQLFGNTDADETLAGFGIAPIANPQTTDPVQIAFAGSVSTAVPELAAFPGGQVGYIEKYIYDRNAKTFTKDTNIPRYIPGGSSIDLTGLAMDLQGSVYVGGTLHFSGNVDTSVTAGVFTTTPGVFAGGRLVRNDDLFVQKYLPTGALAYSALIGGNDFDAAGGLDFDVDGVTYNSGSCISIDQNLDLFITGVSGSFNFPRTRGVYGEVFTSAANVTVTKINSDASQILYSTNLKTNGLVLPSGVSVDARGDAFITGNVHPNWFQFPDSGTGDPTKAANPNVPNSQPLGTIQTTTAGVAGGIETGLITTNPQPTTANAMKTVKGFLNILNTSATTLLYGTYLGSPLDTRCYGPYVDDFGDVWVFGRVETWRAYTLFDNGGNGHDFPPGGETGELAPTMLSPNAFKSVGDTSGPQAVDAEYGLLDPLVAATGYVPWNFTPTTTNPGAPLPTVTVFSRRDGWVDKLRIGLASVQTVTLNPSTLPGGLGASTIGTVTLTQPAPSGGATIALSLNSTLAASFSPTQPTGTSSITIPAGQTTGTFTIYSSPVTVDTGVQVTATYQGSFGIGQLTIIPWLQQLSLTPTSVVGGNSVSGRITLAANPPTGSGGIPVNVLTDTPSIVSFPGGATVTVPEGQSSTTFEIDTNGVGTVSFPQITASLLGVGDTQTLTVTLASLLTLSFNPSTVAGGTISIGTLTLDGQATGPFLVTLSSSDSAFTFDSGDPANLNTLTFKQGDTFKNFNVITPYEPANTQTVITADRAAQNNYPHQSITGTLFVKAADLTTFTINPTEVAGGSPSIGTVIINAAAPTGGVVVNLSSSNTSVATVPATAVIPAGATSAVFTIKTNVIGATATSVITATRGPRTLTQTLTVDGVQFSMTLNPTTVVGGPSGTSTGTITLPAPAPTGGLTFDVTTSDPNQAFFGGSASDITVAVPATKSSATFTVFTNPVPLSGNFQSETPTITATIMVGSVAGASVSQTLTILPVGVASITFNPTTISQRGPRNRTLCTITLNGPSPVDGFITLTSSVPAILNVPTTVPVTKGQTVIRPFVITSNARSASRTLTTTVTASLNGGASAQANVTVTR